MLALAAILPAIALLLPLAHAAPTEARAVNTGFPYGQQKIRGVNLGGWLVLEPFITPSLFDNTGNSAIIDEYTFGQMQDRGVAYSALRQHWDTWITEDDFARIAGAGLNHVRLPVGYWAYDVSAGEPYIQGQAEYVDKAIDWARAHGLKVMLDLHGAPGSQNGYDNSGQRGDARWPYDSNNVQRTKNIVEQLSRKYSAPSYYGTVTALAILNEPATYMSGDFASVTKQFNYDAYAVARYPWRSAGSDAKSGLVVTIHDGFQPVNYNDYLVSDPFESVLLDHHQYTVFSDGEVALSDQDRLNTICRKGDEFAGSKPWIVIGEWSLATTDCARWLNGRNIGARYDASYPGSPYVGDCSQKTGDGSNFSDEYKTYLRKFWDVQTQTYERREGWIFWTWKTENVVEWSYSAGLTGGWIPYNPDEHVSSLSALCN